MGSEKELYSLPDGRPYAVRVERVDGGYRVVCDAPAFEALVDGVSEHGYASVVTGTGSYETRVSRQDGEILVEVAGERFSFGLEVDSTGVDLAKRASGRAEVRAPMPGKVVKLLVESGDSVVAGQGVLLFEAMKMQNEIKSPQDGVIGELPVEEGDAVEARERLFVVRPPE